MPVLRSVNTVCDGRKAYAKAVVQVRPDLKIEDAVFEVKRGSLTVAQAVPAGKVYMIPTPAVKFDKRPIFRSDDGGAVLSGRTQLAHDCLGRHSAVAQTLYAGADRERKLKAGYDSRTGATLAARLKLQRGALHSVAAAINVELGPTFQLKSRPGPGQKLSLAVQPQRQAAIGVVQLQPEGGSTKLRATAVCGLGGKGPNSKLLLDLLWQV